MLEALEQNTLFYHFGSKVKQFWPISMRCTAGNTVWRHPPAPRPSCRAWCGWRLRRDEVITSPITDQGTLIGILYQNAIPVFADLEPHTYNLDPASVEARITPRTKAIIVVHLAGYPCDMDSIMEIARKHGIKVIEDCAQAYMTRYKGRLAGTIGDYGCFSTNDFKHISTGDGGMVLINSGARKDYETAHAFADKTIAV